jgi:predicted DsbA family dithiol-disulfide isomerase
MDKPTIKIGVISDVVCPWCYIGKRRLENAMSKVSDKFNFDIEYFPFELNPKMPVEGVNQKQYLSDKFGGEDRYNQITSHTTAVAAQEGLTFDFQLQQVSPNTRNAHRLIQLAREDGKQLELVEALFKAYFSDGADLSKPENLTAIAVSVGMDKTKIAEFLLSDTGTVEVEMAEHELRELGITGVPFYVINNKYGVSGAQLPESFIKIFEEIRTATPSLVGGEACDVDGKNC